MGRLYGGSPQSKGTGGGRLYQSKPDLFQYKPEEEYRKLSTQRDTLARQEAQQGRLQRQQTVAPSNDFLAKPFWQQVFSRETAREILPTIGRAAKKVASVRPSDVVKTVFQGTYEMGKNLGAVASLPTYLKAQKYEEQATQQQFDTVLKRFKTEKDPVKKQKYRDLLTKVSGTNPTKLTDFDPTYGKSNTQVAADAALMLTETLVGGVGGKALGDVAAKQATKRVLTKPIGEMLTEQAARFTTKAGATAAVKAVGKEAGVGSIYGALAAVQAGETKPGKITREAAKMAALAPVFAGVLKLGAKGLGEVAANAGDLLKTRPKDLKPRDILKLTRAVDEAVVKEAPPVIPRPQEVPTIKPVEAPQNRIIPDQTVPAPQLRNTLEQTGTAQPPREIKHVVVGAPSGKDGELRLYNGARGTVTTEFKNFDRVKTFPKDQREIIADMAKSGNRNAQNILANPSFNNVEADRLIGERYKGKFDAIRYDNKHIPQKGTEYHDLNSGKFYSVNEDTARVYARQNRELKYPTEQPTTKEPIAKKIEPLVQEAKKYKSAEEFVKAQTTVFHGTPNSNIKTLVPSKNGDLGAGIYLTRDRKTAENFSNMSFRDSSLEARGDGSFINTNTGETTRPTNPGVVEATTQGLKIKVLSPGEYSAEINKLRQPDGRLPINYETIAQKRFKDQGFDGLELKGTPRGENDQILVFSESSDKLKTKSQLTDIWNKANQKLKEVKTSRTTPSSAEDNNFKSRVFSRMKDEHPGELTGDLSYERMNMQKDAEKAIKVISEDKQKAFNIAMNAEPSNDVTSTAVNIAMSEKALQEGNYKLYSRLVRNRSLAQTRRGQELVAEKGSITDNSTARYVRELIDTRLKNLGDSYLSDVKNTVTRTTSKKRAMATIDDGVKKIETKIRSGKLDTKTALDLLDKLECQV